MRRLTRGHNVEILEVLKYDAYAHMAHYTRPRRMTGTPSGLRLFERRCAGGHVRGRVAGTVRMPNSHGQRRWILRGVGV